MIIITGASRGIGKLLFDYFLEKNFEKVVGTYLNTIPENLTNYYKLDILNRENIKEFIDAYKDKDDFTNLTLINCAAKTYNSFAHKGSIDEWKSVIETNLFGTYNMIQSLLPIMRTQKFGRIINFSSVVAIKPTPGVSSYSASKSALWGLTKSISIENAIFNVTINNINMGYSKYGMINDVPDEYMKIILSQIPMGKLCDGTDIINTILFLKNTSYITGSSIDLSGGLV